MPVMLGLTGHLLTLASHRIPKNALFWGCDAVFDCSVPKIGRFWGCVLL